MCDLSTVLEMKPFFCIVNMVKTNNDIVKKNVLIFYVRQLCENKRTLDEGYVNK